MCRKWASRAKEPQVGMSRHFNKQIEATLPVKRRRALAIWTVVIFAGATVTLWLQDKLGAWYQVPLILFGTVVVVCVGAFALEVADLIFRVGFTPRESSIYYINLIVKGLLVCTAGTAAAWIAVALFAGVRWLFHL